MKTPKIVATILLMGLGWLTTESVLAQRLKVDTNSSATDQQVTTFSGNVVEIRKYSFILDVEGTHYQVEIPNGVKLTLRMHKPFFNLQENKVLVEPQGTATNERTSFDLGSKHYIRVNFNHERQMNRIMAAKVKRFNNYEIASSPFPAVQTGQNKIVGQLIKKAGRANWVLRDADTEEFEILLGFQNAKFSGFSILDLKPNTTAVEMTGTLKDDVIKATKIEFWPINN